MHKSIDKKSVFKGRGAVSNKTPRFESRHRELEDDGWNSLEQDTVNPKTELIKDNSKSVISYNESPDVPFDRSINPYRGCEHGCVYCYARPTHAYLGFSPGLDFETKILYKPDTRVLLEQELNHKSYRCQFIALGTNTDPYQPVDRKLRITRDILEVLNGYSHPLSIVTKGAHIEHDLDILQDMASRNLVSVYISLTTLENDLNRTMEPRASSPAKRLNIIAKLRDAGIPTGILIAPVIPALNDHEIETILEEAYKRGAQNANYILLRLPLEISELFRQWLDTHYPLKAKRIMHRIQDCRQGKDYRSGFNSRMRGSGHYADLIANRFRIRVKQLHMDRELDLDTKQFRQKQYSLF